MRRTTWFAAALLALMLLGRYAAADEVVTFPGAAGPHNGATSIRGYLSRPKGNGPFPAVVLLHSCLGLPSDRQAIGTALAGWGYVALFVDDFATRGLTQTCLVDFPEALSDAYGALAYVAGLPFVDSARIGAVGYSQGGDTALRLAVPRVIAQFARPGGPAFAAVAAYYPPCAALGRTRLARPALIMVGAEDTVTPAAKCALLAKGQANVRLVVYPDAAHVFDDAAFAGGREMFGMHLQYDRTSAELAKAALQAFLAATLR